MNNRELFFSTVRHVYTGSYLFYCKFSPEISKAIRQELQLAPDTDLQKYFGMMQSYGVWLRPKDELPKQDVYLKYYRDMEIPQNAFIDHLGVLQIPSKSGDYHFTKIVSPLRNVSGLRGVIDYPFEYNFDYDPSQMEEDVRHAKANDQIALVALGSMYEDAWQIRGYEEFLMDMMDESPICDYILDRIFDIKLRRAVYAARAGAELLTSGDDVANQRTLMFSKEIWRKYIKSRWAKIYQAARDINPNIQIKYHSDGNVTDIIPELIEIGVTILNPVQPECVDVAAVKEAFGKKLVLDGTVGTQTTLPFGTPDDVRNVVRSRKKEVGYDGGIILAPTHMVEPEVPLENILAFIDECKKSS